MTPQPTPPDNEGGEYCVKCARWCPCRCDKPADTQEKDEAGEIAKGVFNWYHTTRPVGGPTLVDKIEEALLSFAATRTAKLEARIAELEGAVQDFRGWNDLMHDWARRGVFERYAVEAACQQIELKLRAALASTPTQDSQKGSG